MVAINTLSASSTEKKGQERKGCCAHDKYIPQATVVTGKQNISLSFQLCSAFITENNA